MGVDSITNGNFKLNEITKNCPLQFQFEYQTPDLIKNDFSNKGILETLPIKYYVDTTNYSFNFEKVIIEITNGDDVSEKSLNSNDSENLFKFTDIPVNGKLKVTAFKSGKVSDS
jgi:hypothetical protein